MTQPFVVTHRVSDPAYEQANKYPAYWRTLPEHWQYIDTYRVNELFPVEDKSGRLLHARKKLLVPGVRTGGKSMMKDVLEAISTLQEWVRENTDSDKEQPNG